MSKYNFSQIEKKFTKKWREDGIYEPNISGAKKPFYNLMMFPYPSAEGLHVGNMYAFTGSDVFGRFKRMQGNQVFEPIGLDGFGIHSENYALKAGTHPMKQAEISEKRFYEQLLKIGNGFAWNEKVETYDPEYYRWTQWIFIQMWKKGLAYRKKQSVNWCPSCKTVLADEQAEGGKCERCGNTVEKKELEQWFFKITKYAEKLLGNLDKLDWSGRVKIAQKNWIGKSEGALIRFNVVDVLNVENEQLKQAKRYNKRSDTAILTSIDVFTTRPDTLFGATYLVLAPEHWWLEQEIRNPKSEILNKSEIQKYIEKTKKKTENERIENKEKTGIELKGIKAINPANKEEIPIWVADYVLPGYGTGAIMAVPAHDERDFEFAKKYNLPIKEVIKPKPLLVIPRNAEDVAAGYNSELTVKNECWVGEGELINSEKFSGMTSEKAREKITKFVGGELTTKYRLRDWLISRQRYWGVPIPMVFCELCAKEDKGEQKGMEGWYAVSESNLPVELPFVGEFRPQGKGESPLASVESFYKVKCPGCGTDARRETDVSDTFLDSAWYYLRYLDSKNNKKPFDKLRVKKWCPVDMYIGGLEHSVLHLLYIRFVAMALKDMNFIPFEEPIEKFRAHGLLIKDGAKMSKSKGNVINPDKYIEEFGADAFRMYLMFLAPFEEGGDFRDHGILGTSRFLDRVWKLSEKISEDNPQKNNEIEYIFHKTIKKVTEDIELLHYNTAISSLMILLNELEKKDFVSKENFKIFVKLLAPFAPFITEELWEMLGGKNSIHLESWPEYDKKKIIEDKFILVVQINGKVRAKIEVSADISENRAKSLALEDKNVMKFTEGKKVEKIIYIKGKLVSIVVK